MILSDFIGTPIKLGNKNITIDFIGLKDGYVLFAYQDKNDSLKVINSNKVSIEVEHINRPAFHGKTTFIGKSLINATWVDDEGKLIKAGQTKNLEAALSDIRLRNKGTK